ncbi:MAG: alpha/beta hydrolase [Clostridia bacterium]|nr:alpha/beta hydrolase [Clostridia bacterium]
MRKKAKKALKYTAITAAAGAGLLFASGAVICEGVLGRTYLNHGPEEPLNDPGNLRRYLTNEAFKNADDWFAANCKGDTVLVTKDGDRIHANIIMTSGHSHKWAVLVHGFSSRPRTMAKQGYHYAQMGFNTLFPFMRGHRNDTHKHTTFGYYERYDVIEWINYIISCDPEAEILMHGCSMGAATTMLVTGEKLPANVKCAVADCGFTSAWEEFREQIGNILHLPAFPFLNAANLFANLFLKWDFKECSPLAAVGRSHTPTLFIHGENDTFVPYRMMDVLYDNCAAEKDKLSVPGAAHDESCEKAPELYWEKTDAFVGKYFK